MGKLKSAFLAAVAVVVGVLTLKRFRNRGSDDEDEESG